MLPAIRRTGRYDHSGLPPASPEQGRIGDLPLREAELWLQMVREARLTRGPRAALSIWGRSPLPPISPVQAVGDPETGHAVLDIIQSRAGILLADARRGDDNAQGQLAQMGLRARNDGLFVSNANLGLFSETAFDRGQHRGALLSLPGVQPLGAVLSLAGVQGRGLILPWALLDGEAGQ